MTPPAAASCSAESVPICVLGLGLIGGSVVRAAAAAGRTVFAYNRSPGPVAAASADGFDASTDLPAVLARARRSRALVVLAVTLPALDPILDAIARHAPDVPLTDVVSVKQEVAAAVARHGLAARFVGGHPMAGTAESGWEAGSVDLFHDAVWVVAVDDDADAEVWGTVADLAHACGAQVVPAESAEHDRAVARISHLPHILAEALAVAGAAGGDLALGLGAGSFRDGTRVAATAPTLVRAMCEGNGPALLSVLDETLDELGRAREALAAGSVESLADRGHAARLRFDQRTRNPDSSVVPGTADWIGRMRDLGRRGDVWVRR